MARPYTGKEIKRTAEVKQKNGDVYIYERVYKYDRDKKRTVVISNRLIGKRRAGESETVITKTEPPTKDLQKLTARSGTVVSANETSTLATIRACVQNCSGIGPAVELCLPATQQQLVLDGLWNDLIVEELVQIEGKTLPQVSLDESDYTEIIENAAGLSNALLRLRLLDAGKTGLETLTTPGDPATALVLQNGVLIGISKLPDMLSLPVGLSRIWTSLRAEELLHQRTYIGEPATDAVDVRHLLQLVSDFVVPLSAECDLGVRLLAETRLHRHQNSFYLPEADAFVASFSLRLAGTLEVTNEQDSELTAHFYSFPGIRNKESAALKANLDTVTQLLTNSAKPEDLNLRARNLQRRFLREDNGSWVLDEEAFRQRTEIFGNLILLANCEQNAAAALQLYNHSQHWDTWLAAAEIARGSTKKALMLEMQRETLTEIIELARTEKVQSQHDLASALVEDGATAFLRNALVGEIIAELIEPEMGTPSERKRTAIVAQRLRQAAERKKTAVSH